MKDEFYRPANIEFHIALDGSDVPESFGTFETQEDLHKFLHKNLIAVNSALTVTRHMDAKEKKDIREEYEEILENILPVDESRLKDAELKLNEAKKEQKTAEERYNATISKAKDLAYEAKRGLKEMKLDDKFTFRLAYKSRYYFFTYVDKKLRLCAIRDIPEQEKTEIWNDMAINEKFIEKKLNK